MTDADVAQSAELEDLLEFIREARGFDFTGYKRTSLTRRILKRMHDVGVEHYHDYRDLLETNGTEFDDLFNTILINVTGFFRDPSAWQVLQQEIIPDIITMASSDDEIRIWSAGCSSGEEAYSLAIAFAEVMGLPEFLDRVKIYATDVDEQALQDARTGQYPAKAVEGLAQGLIDTYFEARGDKFAVRPDVRRRVIFGRHDITRDAPISRLHLLACRNTLMYFNVESQSEIVDRFRFALRDNGYLFLGKAEMLLSDTSRFEIANMRQRIFRRRAGDLAVPHQPALRFEILTPIGTLDDNRRRQVRDLVLDVAPDGIIALDIDGTVVLVNGQARTTLGLTSADVGRPFRDLEVSYRPAELRSLIERAQLERHPLRVNAIEFRRGVEESEYYDVLIQPLSAADGTRLGTSLVFVDTTHATRLQQELKRNREDLETAYEELQSTNEELETTNEELQSTNEELETMNEEMRIRSSELEEARAFLEAILTSVAASVIVLDANLTVRTWNRGAQDMWGLRADEAVDHPFFDLDFGLPTAQLREAIHDCLTTGERQQLLELHAVNRLGRGIVSSVACSPLDGRPNQGVVLLMEELRGET